MSGYGSDFGRPGGPRRGYDVWNVPDAAPQAGMYPGPWGEGRFTFRRGDGRWHDEGYEHYSDAAGVIRERRPARRGPGNAGGGGYGEQGGRYGGGYAPRYDREYGRGGRRERPQGGASDRVCAWQIMTEDPQTVSRETTLAEVARTMRDLDVGIIPVTSDEGRLEGVITDRDLVVRALAEGTDGSAKVADFMTGEVRTVGRNDTIHDVLDIMKRDQVRRVPVTDADGRLVGIIAQADLAVSYAGLDLEREAEVEEAIERISEPARRPRGRAHGVRRSNRY